ncbi:hypothetical protein E0L36_11830 [Streptomyces sp. AJS327]|uniref:protein phosphatase 2C domain-containing protein n=1 Tax=Streptomyces sp. AJS327 TaxID=2545265 RepID=UPI0015DF3E8E|nr:protein phosphatase 2C domain-containing protein [Streptomyces sp. AJS327]MBA0051558.1 hypothetical protein [Streptomyces sp. AJS327]
MRIELTSEPGDPGRPNEDHASVAVPALGTGGVLVVLDGVTPPRGDDGCVHGVPWFTARLGGALLELAGSHRELTLRQCLSRAIARTAEAHRGECDLSHVRTPQATVVLARWDADTVDHLVLSDSALLVETVDGTVEAVLDPRLSTLPDAVRALRERGDQAGYARAVEALRNAPGGEGFYTAAADPEVAEHAVTGGRERASVRALLGLTDGAARWTETFRLGGWAELFALVHAEGPAGLVSRVRHAESEPPQDGPRRGKRHDDATAVLVEFDSRPGGAR